MPTINPQPSAPMTLQAALQSDDWFASCPPPLQQALLSMAVVRRLEAGEALFTRGSPASGMYCMIAGAVHIGAHDSDGRAAVLAYLEPYQWFGEISVIDGQPRTHDAIADLPGEVLVIPGAGLEQWLESHPQYWRDVARLTCRKLRVSFAVLEELAQLPLEERVLRRLRLLAQGYGSRDIARQRIRVGQEVLARMLGISRQSVNQALRQLAAKGLVRLHYGEIELLD